MEQAGDLDAIRADLSRRIRALGARSTKGRVGDLAPDIEAIRVIAHRAGLNPAVTVTHFLGSALARGEGGGALLRGWLPVLSDAVASERQDVAACHAYAAACSVRLAN